MDFIMITNDGDKITSKMPADETVVEVKLDDGSVTKAFYSCNIMDAGDWDFTPVDDNDEPTDGDSLSGRIVGWRYVQ